MTLNIYTIIPINFCATTVQSFLFSAQVSQKYNMSFLILPFQWKKNTNILYLNTGRSLNFFLHDVSLTCTLFSCPLSSGIISPKQTQLSFPSRVSLYLSKHVLLVSEPAYITSHSALKIILFHIYATVTVTWATTYKVTSKTFLYDRHSTDICLSL